MTVEPMQKTGFFRLGGVAALVAGLAALGVLFYVAPLFSAISVGIGGVVAVILHVWHKRRPIKDAEDTKHPLGLE